ncbi:MAG: TIGR03016 family PEP-CTERM system-associated outer membrane protein [Hydrogenophaga sp.]|uniref:TIGR03016 family PEP-CTERM system-associated outer membrane protein n=1 Tax=Hydrogenophaga crocea TaxID=2716225 RepID=A0A6G8IFE6_9BURK|nr:MULTISPECIES: TIGR03016 family PEP-CTERM system-associated outer membrane protein [Hydrogenophaga]MBL0945289.1 TIGR03016 family PEP-CTERM system-associated outer membrane protein [Hydrogenophaga sp.]QIM51863.1 TIGR03016 family PEP-CTERM system-associated outer membrane protein [Hydrogenophaga crocea]
MTRTPVSPTPGLRHAIAAACLLAVSPWLAAQGLPAPSNAAGAADATLERPSGPPPRLWIEPRVFVTQTYSDNYRLANTNREAELTTELGAGVSAAFNLPRLTGNVDYSLSGQVPALGVGENQRRQALQSDLLLDAWNQAAFIEFNGNIGDERVSALGPQPVGGTNPTNLSETKRFRVSPFLRGTWDNRLDYELRYTRQSWRTAISDRYDMDETGWNARLGSAAEVGRLGWELSASQNEIDYNAGRSTTYQTALALLRYAFTPTLQGFVQGGREYNDLLTPERTGYNSHTLGVDWRPVELARVAASRSKHFYGNGHDVALEYRMRRVLLRYTDARSLNTGQLGLDTNGATLNELFNNLYQSLEPDPVRRAQLVQAELARLGLQGDSTTLPGYLTASATVQRNQQLSAALLGQRGVLTFLIERSSARRLNNAQAIGDDFDLSNTLDEQGWAVLYAHRLTPRLALNFSLTRRETEGQVSTLSSRQTAVSVGLSARLARRTTGSVLLRHTSTDSLLPYRETAILGALVQRF